MEGECGYMKLVGNKDIFHQDEYKKGMEYPPSTFRPPPTTFASQPTGEFQPSANQLLQLPLPRRANDHLFLTLALMCACCVLGVNVLGFASLLPALICSAMGYDYNKEGEIEKARSVGKKALICNIVVTVMSIVIMIIVSVILIILATSGALYGYYRQSYYYGDYYGYKNESTAVFSY